jgi:hypothetical protein
VLAVVGLTWPSVLAMHRGRRFRGLILRELEETAPWPLEPPDQPAKGGELRDPWWARQQKNFVHREILADPSSNRDFILSLDPTLVYLMTQLWDSLERHDGHQWLWYLHEIATGYDQGGRRGRSGVPPGGVSSRTRGVAPHVEAATVRWSARPRQWFSRKDTTHGGP